MNFRRGFGLHVQCEQAAMLRRVHEIGQRVLDVITKECKPPLDLNGLAGLDCSTAAMVAAGTFHTIMMAASQVLDAQQFAELEVQVERYMEALGDFSGPAAKAASQAVKS
jgi:hypothetical protein